MKRSNVTGDYMRVCPAHDDVNASLHVTELTDGRTLLHCFAGCRYSDIATALERDAKSGRAPAPARRAPSARPLAIDRNKPRLTVVTLAKARKLPVEFLETLGIRNLPFKTGVAIPYHDEQGKVLLEKRRHYLSLTEAEERAGLLKFSWPARTSLRAYGLQFLAIARRAKRLVLVEGESDCWTLWLHAVPALGLPGSSSVSRVLGAQHLEGIDSLLVVKEADHGGAVFVREVAARVRAVGFGGEVFVLDMNALGAKDTSDLYLRKPKTFRKEFAPWAK